MKHQPQLTVIERAFEVAASGRVQSIQELRNALQKEGYADASVDTAGLAIKRQLKKAIRQSQEGAAAYLCGT
jgi:hypothetical protein